MHMKKFKGISVFPGIAIGPAFVYSTELPPIPRYYLQDHHVEEELQRFRGAVERAVEEIERIKEGQQGETVKILDSHLLMLRDPEFTGSVERDVAESKRNVEWILLETTESYVERLKDADDDYLRERIYDIRDIANRILNHLLYRERILLSDLQEEVILVCHDLLPSEAIQMNKRMVKGIAMDAGGRTSHTAILARAFEIPSVLGLSEISRQVKSGQTLIVDGRDGVVIVDPTPEVMEQYQQRMREVEEQAIQLLSLNEVPGETRDGKRIFLRANIEVPEEVESVLAHGADGIGLFRTEFLFMHSRHLPTEEEQYAAYREVIEQMGDREVIIRTLDLGGEKVIPRLYDAHDEHNPILGWRAIRFCLANPHIFKIQLRAILRASIYGKVSIMFPLISSQEEVVMGLEILDQVKEELEREGIPFERDIPVGAMIEVPAAALTADILAQKVDFFSIGTNDLIQYTLATDRGNERVAYLYQPFHPAVLRLIQMTVDHAHQAGIPVGMCGEMAGDPLATFVLIGLGLDELSMSPASIPEVKRLVRSTSVAECEEFVGAILQLKSHREVERVVREKMEELGHVGAN
ncbi:phosphoenolpyruvate-protein phosphotransferase [Spirochaeta thermophila DSM 6192]|uniref:Phosphoenolpyruvate-protein phosphotransferase n=2 Tax=Winmispira thermophila TaxID=154 RepID=E0RTK9_WINT6|nr:phosphoenolpyruvate-protein phosphotransferase [Spirochaeta thermophila DSM 6192]